MSKVLVTGATSFIGKMLCHRLVEKGYLVAGTVRSPEKLTFLPKEIEFSMVDEIGLYTNWAKTLNEVDTIIHLAARVHVMHETSSDSLNEYRRVNTEGTKRLADMAATVGVRRIIYLSTIKVNGEKIGSHPFTEEDPVSPDDPYAISKWEAEQILKHIADETGLEVAILRPPLVYGPNVKANFLKLLEWINKGIPLPLRSVNNTRSLIYLDNLVDAIVKCIQHPAASGEIFLVSDNHDISTPDLIRMIANTMGKKPKLIPVPLFALKTLGKFTGKSMEVERLTGSLQIDSSKIRKVLGWKPPFTLEEGIAETVKWYLKRF